VVTTRFEVFDSGAASKSSNVSEGGIVTERVWVVSLEDVESWRDVDARTSEQVEVNETTFGQGSTSSFLVTSGRNASLSCVGRRDG